MPVSPKDTARDTARAVWRRIPPGLRRSLLFGTTRIAAPAARMPGPPPAEPIVIVGPISSATGLGEGARLAMRALRDQGLDVRGVDVSPVMLGGDPAEPIDPGLPVPAGPGTVILHVNAPLAPLALLMLGRPALRGKRIIGYFAWELPDLPDDWIAALDHVHEIWVPSRFTADAFRRHTEPAGPCGAASGPGTRHKAGRVRKRAERTPLHRADAVQHGFRLHAEEPGSGGARVQAGVRRGRGADARLILKTHHVSAYAAGCGELAAAIDGDPRITRARPHDGPDGTGRAGRLAATRSCCCTGRKGSGCRWPKRWDRALPVVATNWSGNTDFMDFGNSCPVSYCLVPARDPQGSYDHADQLWAEPSAENAAVHLRRLRDNPALGAELGQAASLTIRERCSPRGLRRPLGRAADGRRRPVLREGAEDARKRRAGRRIGRRSA